ncbi:MAG TPA: S8 family serine peptidase [Vicinamibacterales bacterium]|nr:S8 family serine peptidase [Vicinamibacterales bacterium]
MLAANSDRPHLDSLARAARDANASSRIIVRYRPGAGPRMRTLMASGRKLRSLAADPTVAGISTDVVIRATGAGLSPAFSSLLPSADVQQLRRTLGLGALPLGGRGVGIAVVDSGIAPMPDLAGRITAFYDFTAGGIPTFPSDQYGHGTHVAGLIAGSGALSAGAYPGIAPEGRLIGLKVLDANGAGYTSDVIAAIEFATDHRASLGIDVINLSLGHPVLESAATDPLVQAVERAAAAGIVVVASAGNFGESRDTFRAGFGGISSPGNAPSALTVGAIRTNATVQRADDVVPSFSSRGPTWFDGNIKPDIVAPGVSLIATSHPGSTLALRAKATTGYLSLSGTSMASAVAAGVVALMIEANRLDHGHTRLTPNTVKMLLQYSAVAVGAPSNTAELIEGAGGINAAGAIGLARAIDPSTQVGGHWLEHGITPATRIAGTLLPWTRRVTWGDRLVVGEVVSRKESAWSARGLWGAVLGWSPDTWVTNSTVLASFVEWSSQVVKRNKPVMALGDDHIVWGNVDEEDAVWGSCSAAEGDHIVWGNCGEHIVWGNTVTQGTR